MRFLSPALTTYPALNSASNIDGDASPWLASSQSMHVTHLKMLQIYCITLIPGGSINNRLRKGLHVFLSTELVSKLIVFHKLKESLIFDFNAYFEVALSFAEWRGRIRQDNFQTSGSLYQLRFLAWTVTRDNPTRCILDDLISCHNSRTIQYLSTVWDALTDANFPFLYSLVVLRIQFQLYWHC